MRQDQVKAKRGQLNLFESGEALRDQALERLEQKNETFMARGIVEIAKLPVGEYTGEDIRFRLAEKDIAPKHPNAWGALIMSAVRSKILRDSGKTTKMKARSSHARKTTIYVKGHS